MSATQKQSDVDIALTSKRINMALDEFIKESKNEKRNNHAKNRIGKANNRPRTNTNNNHNNNNNNNNNNYTTKKFISSPRVKKTLSVSPMKNKLVSPDKIKIQIQNNKAKPLPKPISIRPKIRVATQQRSIRAPTRSVATKPTRTVTASSNKPTRFVKHYEKPITLNDRFSKK
ncbi:hypothetical protein ACTFIZ_003364 [Dictyostelium cf. discoideum]